MIGLFELYDAETELSEATAETLGRVFRAHLHHGGPQPKATPRNSMRALLDEVDAAAGQAA